MICNKCGHDNTPKREVRDPWCMYKVENGIVINKLFDPLYIPDGWYDSPRAARAGIEPKKSEAVEKSKTPPYGNKEASKKAKKRKVKNGNNSARVNK